MGGAGRSGGKRGALIMRIVLGTLLLAAAGQFAWSGEALSDDRIVSVGGSITEIVYALGAGDRIVAADTTSVYPAETAELPKVGYMRQIAAEPILALDPDLIIASEDAGPPAVLEQIAAAGVPLTIVVETPDADGVVAKIRQIAAALGRDEEGEALAAETAQNFQSLADVLAPISARPSVLFLLGFADNAPMAAGSNTAADGIIALAGGSNAISGYDGYKPLSPETAATLDPAIVVVSAHSVDMAGGLDALKARPDLGAIPAVQEGRILVMDANYLLGFGPRSPDAARELASQLHPGLFAAAP